MTFNHYAKIKRILNEYDNWYVVRVDEVTRAKNFRGEIREFDHYYRVYDTFGNPIKYCKFQQLERLASVLGVPAEELPVVTQWRR